MVSTVVPLIIASIILIALGIWRIASPRTAFEFRNMFKSLWYKDAEPTEDALSLTRVIGVIYTVIGVIVLLVGILLCFTPDIL